MFRFITKHLAPNYVKLRDMNLILEKFVEPAVNNRYAIYTAQALKTNESNYSWILNLSSEQVLHMTLEWKALMQSTEGKNQLVKRNKVAQLPSYANLISSNIEVTWILREQLLSDFNKNKEMWMGLQNIKYKYQNISAESQKSFLRDSKNRFTQLCDKASDSIHQNKMFGVYVSMAEELDRTYERATENGAANELQNQVLVAGGLYRVAKNARAVVVGALAVASGVGIATGIKKIVTGAANIVNCAGGLIKGITDKLRGREADYRRLSAQAGLDNYLKNLEDELFGRTQEPIFDQVNSGPARLFRGAALHKEKLDKLEKDLRHSLFWMRNWELDLAALSKDFNDSEAIIPVLQRRMSVAIKETSCVDADNKTLTEAVALENVVNVKLEKDKKDLTEKIRVIAVDLARLKCLLQQDLIKISELRASVNTRLAIAGQQVISTRNGQYNQMQRLAHEAAQFHLSGAKLKPVADRILASVPIRKISHSSLTASEENSESLASNGINEPTESIHALLVKALARNRMLAHTNDSDDLAVFDGE